MKVLDRKLARDVWHMKGQALAIALVIAGGIATFVLSRSMLESLISTRDAYYDGHRFAHIFAGVKRAPLALADRLAEVPGVAQVQCRVVVDVSLDLEDLPEPATGRLISIPDGREPTLNGLFMREGRWPELGRPDEILVSEAFAEAHEYRPGDSLVALINGRRRSLQIVGVVLSPEYVYSIRGGDLFPDDLHFGVLWMQESGLAAAYDMEGAFNDVAIRLSPGTFVDETLALLDPLLRPYGGLGAISREFQVSHWYLSGEMRQLRTMGLFVPLIFLGVAAFLLNIVLNRLISLERDQIAILKAFGYTDREVGFHYLKLAGVIIGVGSVVGILIGAWLGRNLAEMYTEFFRFPELQHSVSVRVMWLALLVGAGAGIAGALGAIRRATALPPAEAMRPEPPANYRPTIVERWGLQRWFSQPARMILRYLERRPFKSFLSCLGIALSVAVVVVGLFTVDAIEYVVDIQFELAQREDAMVTFFDPASYSALPEVRHLPGAQRVEPFRSVPARLRNGHRSRRGAVLGLVSAPRLHRIVDRQLRPTSLPPDGLLLNRKFAEILAVDVGDKVTIEVLEGAQPVHEAVVAGLVEEFFGLNAYMEIRALNRMMQEGATISGAFLTVEDGQGGALYRETKQRPGVAGVTLTTAAYESFKKTLAESLLTMTIVNVIFASVIAFGVVYNSARIALSERSRELATLRVLGYTRAEISFILLGELAAICLVALPLGCALGYGLGLILVQGFDTEVYRIPLIITPRTYAFACGVVVVAALISGLVVRRRLDHLDLVAVLKSRE